MIKTHSDDPDVESAADRAYEVIKNALDGLPKAESFNYGGHTLELDAYNSCTTCTTAIAEAQAAEEALKAAIRTVDDDTIREHINMAAYFFHCLAEEANVRAELHNGKGTEKILNIMLGFEHDRQIADQYSHSHQGGKD